MIRRLLGLDWDLELLDGAMIDEVSGGAGINHGDEARLVRDWVLDMFLDWMLNRFLDWMLDLILDWMLDCGIGAGGHSDLDWDKESGGRRGVRQTAGRRGYLTQIFFGLAVSATSDSSMAKNVAAARWVGRLLGQRRATCPLPPQYMQSPSRRRRFFSSSVRGLNLAALPISIGTDWSATGRAITVSTTGRVKTRRD